MICERCHQAPAVIAIVESGRQSMAAELCASCHRAWRAVKAQLLNPPAPRPKIHVVWSWSSGSSTTSA